jgi:hypothetical protein
MQRLSQALSLHLPLVMSHKPIDSAEQKLELRIFAQELSEMVHRISDDKAGFGQDPTLKPVAREFRSQMSYALTLIQWGKWNAARRKVAGVTQYCIGCHTMHMGPGRPMAPVELSPDLSGLSEAQQGEYFAAVRQTDKAIIHFEYALVDRNWARAHPREWGTDFQRLLAVVVRQRKSPSLSLELVSRFIDAGSYPVSLKPVARLWRRHLKEWREYDNSTDSPTPAEQAALAGSLIEEADRLYPRHSDQRGFVLYLRASGMLQDLLASRVDSKLLPEIAYKAGLVSERLASLNLWALPEDFYLLCLEEDKETIWRNRCAKRLSALELGLS